MQCRWQVTRQSTNKRCDCISRWAETATNAVAGSRLDLVTGYTTSLVTYLYSFITHVNILQVTVISHPLTDLILAVAAAVYYYGLYVKGSKKMLGFFNVILWSVYSVKKTFKKETRSTLSLWNNGHHWIEICTFSVFMWQGLPVQDCKLLLHPSPREYSLECQLFRKSEGLSQNPSERYLYLTIYKCCLIDIFSKSMMKQILTVVRARRNRKCRAWAVRYIIRYSKVTRAWITTVTFHFINWSSKDAHDGKADKEGKDGQHETAP